MLIGILFFNESAHAHQKKVYWELVLSKFSCQSRHVDKARLFNISNFLRNYSDCIAVDSDTVTRKSDYINFIRIYAFPWAPINNPFNLSQNILSHFFLIANGIVFLLIALVELQFFFEEFL